MLKSSKDWKDGVPGYAKVSNRDGCTITFGERIELGKIFSKDWKLNETGLIDAVFSLLYDIPEALINVHTVVHTENIIKGIASWIDLEKLNLHIDPTDEQKAAGISRFERLGYFPTIKALAAEYNKDFDEVLAMPYTMVYTILWSDAEEAKYNRRLQKIQERKAKNSKSWQRK